MAKAGLITRQEIGRAAAAAPRPVRSSAEQLARAYAAGPAYVAINPQAKHASIPPDGPSPCSLYVLGEAPGAQEDDAGRPFVGVSGQLIRSAIPRGVSARYHNTVSVRPPNNRTPTPVEVEAYRAGVEADLAAARPAVVLALGNVAASWFIGNGKDNPGIEAVRGRDILYWSGDHPVYVVPTYHPAYVLRVRGDRGGRRTSGGEQAEKAWRRDVAYALKLAADPPKPPPRIDPREAERRVAVIRPSDGIAALRSALADLGRAGRPLAFDLETRGDLYHPEGRALCASVSTGDHSVAFPLDYPEAAWADGGAAAFSALLACLAAGPAAVAHNLTFDVGWLIRKFGARTLTAAKWHDTRAMHYVRDPRPGQSLALLSQQYLGLNAKSITEVDRSNLAAYSPERVMTYCGVDSLITARLASAIRARLVAEKLDRVYLDSQRGRAEVVALMTSAGMPVDAAAARASDDRLAAQEAPLLREIADLPVVREHERRTGRRFSPASNDQLGDVLAALGVELPKTKTGKAAVGESVLEQIDHPLTKKILELREVAKLRGYSRRFIPGVPDSHVSPDGCVHTRLKTTNTVTGRLASEDPNLQNVPNRTDEGRRIRAAFVAPPGMRFLCVDYGQLEYRGIGWRSRDRVIVASTWDGYDVHLAWAKKLRGMLPEWWERKYAPIVDEKKALKAARGDVKSTPNFCWFYKGGVALAARILGVSEARLWPVRREFEREFAGVFRMHDELIRQYERDFYVEGLDGRRRHGPMNINMIVNSPIQGACAGVVCAAMVELAYLSVEQDRPYLCPRLNIHDDLTFLLPEDDFDRHARDVIRPMISLAKRFPWINTPVVVEAKHGPTWYDLKPYGDFSDQHHLGRPRHPDAGPAKETRP